MALRMSLNAVCVIIFIIRVSFAFIVQGNGMTSTTPQTNRPDSSVENLRNLLKYEQTVREELEHRMNTMEKLYDLKFDMLEKDYKQQVSNLASQVFQKLNQTVVELNRTKFLLQHTVNAPVSFGTNLSALELTVAAQRQEVEKQANVDGKMQDEINNLTANFLLRADQVLFRALLTQPVPFASESNGGWKKVVYDRVHINLGHGYNSSTGIFSAPYNGIYHFHAQGLARHGHDNFLSLRHGQNRIAYSYSPAYNTTWNHNSVSAGSYCKKDDLVWVEYLRYLAESTDGTPTGYSGQNTYFTGDLVKMDA